MLVVSLVQEAMLLRANKQSTATTASRAQTISQPNMNKQANEQTNTLHTKQKKTGTRTRTLTFTTFL
jgi:hypothetical protein